MQSLNYGLRIGMPKGQQIDEIVPDLVTQSGKSFRKLKSKVEKPEIKRIKQSQFDLKIKFYEFSQQALINKRLCTIFQNITRISRVKAGKVMIIGNGVKG